MFQILRNLKLHHDPSTSFMDKQIATKWLEKKPMHEHLCTVDAKGHVAGASKAAGMVRGLDYRVSFKERCLQKDAFEPMKSCYNETL